jgi:hypothetical protein
LIFGLLPLFTLVDRKATRLDMQKMGRSHRQKRGEWFTGGLGEVKQLSIDCGYGLVQSTHRAKGGEEETRESLDIYPEEDRKE